jgi:4-aminobutyrate aminotransferase-like enzyme
VELNRDPLALEPAEAEADRVINEMKENGILLSTDGPDHNVIKIKPPLVFNVENAHFLAETLDYILTRITQKMKG